MHRLIFVDMTLSVVAALGAAQEAVLLVNELRLVCTGTQEVAGVPRYYYAAEPPLRLLIVMRDGGRLEEVRPGQYLKALVGWDDGQHAYTLPGEGGKAHTKLSVDLVLDLGDAQRGAVELAGVQAGAEVLTLSAVVARAPRSDRPGGWRGAAPGRPPVRRGDRVESHNVTLPSQLWRRVERAGAGNRSAGVRKLIEGDNPMHVYEVGKPYITGRQQWLEFGEYNFRGGEHELRLFWDQPSEREIADVARGRAEFGLFVEEGLIIFLYRFGYGEWSDAPFTIHMVPAGERVLPAPLAGEQRVALHVMLVGANDGIVRALRFVSFSSEFSQKLHAAIAAQADLSFDQAAYDAHLARVYKLNSSTGLSRLALVRCQGGA